MVDKHEKNMTFDEIVAQFKRESGAKNILKRKDINAKPSDFWSSDNEKNDMRLECAFSSVDENNLNLVSNITPQHSPFKAMDSVKNVGFGTLPTQELQYRTPSKRMDPFDILKSSNTVIPPQLYTPKRKCSVSEDSENQSGKKKKIAGCPVHPDQGDGDLFVDIPTSPCKYASCIHYYEKITPIKKKSLKKKSPTEPRKRTYCSLNLSTGNTDNKPSIDKGVSRAGQQSSSNTNPVKTASQFSTQSFYGKSRPTSIEKTTVLPTEVEVITSNNPPSPLLPSRSRAPIRTPIRTRSHSVSSDVSHPHEMGFKNFGNTCYVNAIMQVLLAIPGFIDDFGTFISSSERPENDPNWFPLIPKIVTARNRGSVQEVNNLNKEFINCLKTLNPCYGSGDQQDANEFLVRIIEKMQSQLPAGIANPVESHFQCELVEIFRCLNCDVKVKRPENHTSICLPIMENSHNLEQCLEDFTAEEERSITCTRCHEKRMMVCNKFRTLPNKLVMSLNRYSKEEKVVQPIIPLKELDIRRFMEFPSEEEQTQYTLFAQVVHIGKFKNSGHYVSHIFCEDGLWRCYNDQVVTQISFEGKIQNVSEDPGYIYFYVQSKKSKQG